MRLLVALCGIEFLSHACYQAHLAFPVLLRQGGTQGHVACIRVDMECLQNVWIRERGGVRKLLDDGVERYLLRVAPYTFDILSEDGG